MINYFNKAYYKDQWAVKTNMSLGPSGGNLSTENEFELARQKDSMWLTTAPQNLFWSEPVRPPHVTVCCLFTCPLVVIHQKGLKK